MEIDPENIDAMNSTATCIKNLATSDYFDHCLSIYMRALEVDPEDFETNFNIGILYYDQRKDAEKAMHYLKIAIAEDKQPTALFNLAVIYEEQGDRVKAKETYKEILQIKPDHYKSKVNLAIILEKEGESKEAH